MSENERPEMPDLPDFKLWPMEPSVEVPKRWITQLTNSVIGLGAVIEWLVAEHDVAAAVQQRMDDQR